MAGFFFYRLSLFDPLADKIRARLLSKCLLHGRSLVTSLIAMKPHGPCRI